MCRLLLFATLLAVVAAGCQPLSEDSSRQVGERLSHALETGFDAPIETYLAPGAQVFLQGSDAISADAFSAYVGRLQQNHQFYQRASQVYATRTGAGWFADIRTQNDTAQRAPTLWMEMTIQADRITRLWVDFTPETLDALHHPRQAYVDSMAANCLPVPDGWQNGTSAMRTAAEAFDRSASATAPSVDAQSLLVVAGVALLASALTGLALARKRLHSTRRGQLQGGRLLRQLRKGPTPENPQTSIPV